MGVGQRRLGNRYGYRAKREGLCVVVDWRKRDEEEAADPRRDPLAHLLVPAGNRYR
jgi:hypothetical protein